MNVSKTFTLASSAFSITVPEKLALDTVFRQYCPFEGAGGDLLTSLHLTTTSDFLAFKAAYNFTRYNEEAPYLWLALESVDNAVKVVAGFSNTKPAPQGIFIPSPDFSHAEIVIPDSDDLHLASFMINNSAMIAYSYTASRFKKLLIHASLVVKDGKAYAFLGRSGTGKSTHARLWIDHLPGARLLNDDNPVIYVKDGRVYASGSPWSGKTACYINEEYPLAGIVRLNQAPQNKIVRLASLQAFAALLPSCSCMKWDPRQSKDVSDTVEAVIAQVPLWHLDCLPDAAAARLCYETISR